MRVTAGGQSVASRAPHVSRRPPVCLVHGEVYMDKNGLKPFFVERPLQVRTYDIDFFGIISNIVYIRWLEDLRLEMLKQYFPLEGQLRNGFAPVLARTRIEYKRPLDIRSTVVGRMWVSDIDYRRWTVIANIVADGKTAAAAEQVGTFVSMSDGRPIKVPDELLSKYRALTQVQDGV